MSGGDERSSDEVGGRGRGDLVLLTVSVLLVGGAPVLARAALLMTTHLLGFALVALAGVTFLVVGDRSS
jgi:hypothetical protein